MKHARAGRLADVQIRLPGLGLQRDDLGPERPRGDRAQVAAFQLLVARDAAIPHPAVDRRDHLDAPRPVLRDERPLDPCVVCVGHADEPAALQCRLPAAAIAEAKVADDGRVPDVELVAVVEQLDVGEPDRVLALDAQLEDQPVRQVDEILVEHGQAAEDRRLAVVASVYVGAGIVHTVGVLPLRRTTCAQVAVARRGERFAKPLSPGIEAVIGERETVHGTSSSVRHGHTNAALTVPHRTGLRQQGRISSEGLRLPARASGTTATIVDRHSTDAAASMLTDGTPLEDVYPSRMNRRVGRDELSEVVVLGRRRRRSAPASMVTTAAYLTI